MCSGFRQAGSLQTHGKITYTIPLSSSFSRRELVPFPQAAQPLNDESHCEKSGDFFPWSLEFKN
jgi:hypothetical protein